MSRPWLKFYPADWRDPKLRMCSLAARGLWIDLMTYMHEAEPYGHLLVGKDCPSLTDIASLVGRPVSEVKKSLEQLEARDVFSRTDKGVIYSRRMVRDARKAEEDKANGKAGGHPDIRRGTVPKEQRARRFRRSDAPAKAQRIFDRSGGGCHWCQKNLDPEHYHIDHVIAVRDGGTNDESNLVAACPECNGERAMVWGRNDSDLMVGKSSDHKAQKLEARTQSPESEDKTAVAVMATKKYAFEGGVVKLSEKHFADWTAAFPNLDLRGELIARDVWLCSPKATDEDRRNWFISTSKYLANRNLEGKAKVSAAIPRQAGGGFV